MEEAGIQGENLGFTAEEKNAAQSIPQTINNYYGNTNVISGPTTNSTVVAGNNNFLEFDYKHAKDAVSEISASLSKESVSQEDKNTALELLEEIDEKIDKKKKPGVIKSALIGLKDFLVSVGAGVTVALLQGKFPNFFS